MSTAIWIAAILFVAIDAFFVWGLCAAAKRGDRQLEDGGDDWNPPQ